MFDGEKFATIKRRINSRIDAVRIACELEVNAPKLGNVHPAAAFSDCEYRDFLTAATKIAPVLGSDNKALALGDRILLSVQRTREVTAANVNLGIILLIAPLAMAESAESVREVLDANTPTDGGKVFEAIRLAAPGGMKRADVASVQDVQTKQSQSIDLIAAMKQAAHRDRIALQYANGFEDFFANVIPIVANEVQHSLPVTDAIVNSQLQLMACDVDSLIARKCGIEIAEEAKQRAIDCLQSDSPAQRTNFDQWLRADGNRRNPGTTADLIAAALFWLLVRG